MYKSAKHFELIIWTKFHTKICQLYVNAQVDPNLRWVHMSEDTFSDVAVLLILLFAYPRRQDFYGMANLILIPKKIISLFESDIYP